jgi:hypothetical protein
MTRQWWSRGAAVGAMSLMLTAGNAGAVELANITADGPGTGSAPALSIAVGQSTPDFFVENATGPGFYPVRIGASRTDDYYNGVLLVSARENGGRTDGLGIPFWPIPGTTAAPAAGPTNADGTINIYIRNRIGATANVLSNSNVAAAYFPYSEGWIGGALRNEANGGNANATSSLNGITLPSILINTNAIESGVSRLFVPGVTDTRQQGLLFVNHSKNEDNQASVAPTPSGDAFIVGVHNGGNALTPEPDPYSFVYIPHGTAGVTMASIHGASGPNMQPTVMNKTGDFTITRTDVGTYRLSIPGQSPTSGVLMTNTGGQINASATSVVNHVVTYQADGNDWIIQTRDWGQGSATVPVIDPVLENPLAERSQSFQFAFMPFTGGPTAPAANPAPFNLKDKVFGFSLQETEVDAALQAAPANYGTVTNASAGFNIQHLRQDRGDNSLAVNGVFPAATDGIFFGTVNQGFRDNTTLPNNPSGQASFGMVAAGDSGGGWEFHTHTVDPGATVGALQEFNVNFSGVFFGVDAGFQMAHQATQPTGGLNVALSGVNSLNDGILVAQAHGNVDHYAVATPAIDGSNWNIKTFNNETTATANAINWLYLPYSAENLVAGRVAADGTVQSSTGPGEFTLTRQGDGAYLLSIAGKTPSDGSLLLTPEGTGTDDNSLVFEASGNNWLITGVDYVTADERQNQSIPPSAQDTPFTFAFIDFDAPPVVAPPGDFLEADFDEDGSVDGDDLAAWEAGFGVGTTKPAGDSDADGDVDGSDFLVWQRQVGTTPPAVGAVGAVPEPGALAMALGAVAGLIGLRRRNA